MAEPNGNTLLQNDEYFYENNRLLPQNDPAAREFIATIERIHERLLSAMLGPDYNRADYKVQFMLSADEEPNAAIATWKQPPLILFSKGLIKLAANESELAAVLAHELTHGDFRKKLGQHDNGKLEEMSADLRAPYMLRKANYPQEAMRTIMQKLPNDEVLGMVFPDPSDPHPNLNLRISALHTAERALVRGPFGMGEQDTDAIVDPAISTRLLGALERITYASTVERILAEKGFQRADVVGQIGILRDIIQNDLPTWDVNHQARSKDITKAFRGLHIQRGNAEHEKAVASIVDAMAKTPEMPWNKTIATKFYRALQQSYEGNGKTIETIPLGGLRTLNESMLRFTQATSPDEIKGAARELNRLANQYVFDKKERGFFREDKDTRPQDIIRFTRFKTPNIDQVKNVETTPMAPSWDRHVQLATQSGDKELLLALKRMGITYDARIQSQLREFQDTPHISMPYEGFLGGPTFRYDANGQLIGLRTENDYFRADEQQAAFTRREQEERAALPSVNWQLLEDNPTVFAQTYKRYLSPEIGTLDGPHPFADAMVVQLKSLNQRDASKGKTVNEAVHSEFTKLVKEGREAHKIGPSEGRAGVSINHPFVQYVMNDNRDGGFDFDRKIELASLSHHFTNHQDTLTPDQRWKVDNTKLFANLPVSSTEEFKNFIAQATTQIGPYSNQTNFLADLVQVEAYRTLANLKQPLSPEDICFFRDVSYVKQVPDEGLLKHLNNLLDHQAEQLVSRNISGFGFDQLASDYRALSMERMGISAFTQHPQLRKNYQMQIKNRIDAETDPAKRQNMLQAILFKQQEPVHGNVLSAFDAKINRYNLSGASTKPATYEGSLGDPEFREWAGTTYANVFPPILGKDDGSQVYAARFKGMVDTLAANAPSTTTLNVLNKVSTPIIGNQLLFQAPLASHVRQSMESQGLKELVGNNLKAAVGEVVLSAVENNSSAKKSVVDFLIKPVSEASSKAFLSNFEKGVRKEDKEKISFISPHLSETAKLEQVGLLHKNFWNLPFAGRVLASEIVLFGTRQDSKYAADEIEENTRYILDKVLPEGTQNAKEGRMVIESYLKATKNDKDKRILLSAMLVANHPEGEGKEKVGMGEALGLVLDALGPAGRKLKQAIESSDEVSEELKKPLKASKTMAVEKRRDEIFEYDRERGLQSADANEKTAYIGRVFGAGSYAVTYEVQKASGEKLARSMLYENVREQASTEFKILEDTAEDLAKKDKRFQPASDMVRQASAASATETDMGLAAKQAEVASKLYNDVKITVDGQTYTFSTPKFNGHGKDYKDFEIVEGVHFNELPTATAAQQAHKHGLAKASMALELYNILSGRPFDHDRHGGQQKIVGNDSKQIDFGAMNTTLTSDRQKQLIGFAIGGIIKGHFVHQIPLSEVLNKEVDRCSASLAEKDFLNAVKRGILALGNFRETLGEQELKQVLGAVYATGKVDPIIIEAIKQRTGKMVADRVFAEIEKISKTSGIVMQIPDRAFDPSPDKSPLGPVPAESFWEKIPLANDTVIEGGAGAVGMVAGFGWLYGVNKKIDQKKQAGAEISFWDRAQQIAAGTIGIIGTAAVIDAATGRNGLKAVTTTVNSWTDQIKQQREKAPTAKANTNPVNFN